MQSSSFKTSFKWFIAASAAALLTACGGGGGGGGGGDSESATSKADPGNGTYTMLASDGYEYSLTVDFDAKTYKVVGNGIDQSGAIAANSGGFEFTPGNAKGSTGTNTLRFSTLTDTIVGEYAVPSGGLPFIAARSFVASTPTTTLTFDLLGHNVNPTSGQGETFSGQGQITSNGSIRLCEDWTVQQIEKCPVASLFEAPLTLKDDVFSYQAKGGVATFRLANIGGDVIFLRASPTGDGNRRFLVGTPTAKAFSTGSFTGAISNDVWGTFSVGQSTAMGTVTTNLGETSAVTGTAVAVPDRPSVVLIDTNEFGRFVATSSAKLGVALAPHSDVTGVLSLFIGVRQ